MAQRNLILLAVGLTVLAFVAAEADFWDEHRLTGHRSYNSTLLTSFAVDHDGEIELDRDQTAIIRMSPDAYLDVGQRRFAARYRLEVRPGPSGEPQYRLRRGSRELSQEEAEEFVSTVLPRVTRMTTVGAQARAKQILEDEGLDALLREVGRLQTNSAQRIYLEQALLYPGLEETGAREIARTAGREMTSSSRLRAVLVEVAEVAPQEWALTTDLARAAEKIASSSEKADALIEIVRVRPVEPGAEASVAEALSTIASSSEKGRGIVRVARLHPTTEQIEQLLDSADTIDSSSERRRVLVELVESPALTDPVLRRALEVGTGIASSTEKASFLVATVPALSESTDLQSRYIEVASEISASQEESRALATLLRETELSEEVCAEWISTSGRIAGSTMVVDLLVQAAADCPNAEPVWSSYLRAVEDVAASSEQRRALVALLERDDLSNDVLQEIESVAHRAIASTSERDMVLDVLSKMPPAGAQA